MTTAVSVDDEQRFIEKEVARGLRRTHRGIEQRQRGDFALKDGCVFNFLLAQAGGDLARFRRNGIGGAVNVHLGFRPRNIQREVDDSSACGAQLNVVLRGRLELRSVHRQYVGAGERNADKGIVAGAVGLDRPLKGRGWITESDRRAGNSSVGLVLDVSFDCAQIGLGREISGNQRACENSQKKEASNPEEIGHKSPRLNKGQRYYH